MTDKSSLDKYIESTLDKVDESIKADYGEEYFKSCKKLQSVFLDFSSSKTETVVKDVVSAVTLEHPERVYSPRRNALFRCYLFLHKIAPLVVQDYIVKIATFIVLRGYLKPAAK